MIESFLITSRETLEASLIVGIVLAYLTKSGNLKYRRSVYLAIFAGILASILAAIGFNMVAGGFEGRTEEIFEGTTMLLGAVLLTTMIMWMSRQKHIAHDIEHKVDEKLHASKMMSHVGIFSLVFVAIIREGVETVIFLNAINYANGLNLISASLGIIVAMVLGYVAFIGFKKIHLKKVFFWSSILLITFAAGLVAHGVHEFQEAGVLPTIVSPLFDINPELRADGSYPLLHESGVIGSFLKGLFGYNGNPNLLEVIAYLLYLIPALFFFSRPYLTRA